MIRGKTRATREKQRKQKRAFLRSCRNPVIEKPREEGHHAVNSKGWYMEDMIMAMRLGRPLADDEVTWHRNGDTLDNRDENLVLMKFGVDWCLEAEYA